jgi:hypothetical protein
LYRPVPQALQEVVKASIVHPATSCPPWRGHAGRGLRRDRHFDRTAANQPQTRWPPRPWSCPPSSSCGRSPPGLDSGRLPTPEIVGRGGGAADHLRARLASPQDPPRPGEPHPRAEDHGGEPWSIRRRRAASPPWPWGDVGITEASANLGLSPFFVGIIVVAVVGNAAEHWVAIYFAQRDKMDLAVNIAIGSSAQIALFVAPVLVLLSFLVGPFPMALVFNGFEIGAIFLAVLVANQVTQEGESTWFEGLQLLAVYVVLGLIFYFVT